MLLTGIQHESKPQLGDTGAEEHPGGHPEPQDTPFHEPGLWAPTPPSLKPSFRSNFPINNLPHLTYNYL